MNAKKLTVADAFEEIKNNEMVLLDVYSLNCPPCRMLLPVYDEVASELKDISVIKIDADENASRVKEFNVSSIPAVILFKNGKEIDRFVGFKPKDTILEWVASHK